MTADSPQRILVVDDEYLIAAFLEELLLDQGCEVIGPVGTVDSALALVAENGNSIDGAFLDINLRGDLVYPVADAITARGVPFAFLTGYGPEAVDSHYIGVPVLGKPFDASKMPEILSSFAKQRGEKATREQ